MRRCGWSRSGLLRISLVLLLAAPSVCAAQGARERAHLQASVTPSRLGLAQRVLYRGRVVLPRGIGVHFATPPAGGALSWGKPEVRRGPITDPKRLDFGMDSVVVSVPLQVFETGTVSVPGMRFRLDRLAPSTGPVDGRLPVVRLNVTAMIAANDTAAQLRPVRGPLGAPWWERIAWGSILAVLVILGVLAAIVIWWRRRHRAPVPMVRAAAKPRVRRDPAQAALTALAALRAQRLPDQGLFGEHALGLSHILREYLEGRWVTPRPGDTSEELLARLAHADLTRDDVVRLEGLLGLWDRVKFARAPMGVDEAHRCEEAVEALVRGSGHPAEVA